MHHESGESSKGIKFFEDSQTKPNEMETPLRYAP